MAAAANTEIIAKRMDSSLSCSTTEWNATFFEFARDFIGAAAQMTPRPNAAAGPARNVNPRSVISIHRRIAYYLIMAPKLKAFVGRTAAAIEYGVIAAGLSLAIIVVVNGLTELNAAFSSISTH